MNNECGGVDSLPLKLFLRNMPKGYTQETFIKRIKEIHGDKIDVSNFEYKNSITSGKAICNICGNVWYPRADVLIRGCGCRKCYDKRNSDSRIIPFEEIQDKITCATIKKETYIDTKHHCEAKCVECGYIWNPNVRDLLNGSGCPECGRKRTREALEILYEKRRKPKKQKLTKEELKEKNKQKFFKSFLERAYKKYGHKFTYDEKTFSTMEEKMRIICPIHGEFLISPRQHLKSVHGCSRCATKYVAKLREMTIDDVKEKIEKIRNGKIKLIDETFKSSNVMARFICAEHGEFEEIPKKLIYGCNCPKCSKTKVLTKEKFVEKANIVHNNKYRYTNTVYVNNRTPLLITCQVHGDFQQTPNDHLDGCGCPKCYSSRLEKQIRDRLNEEGIEYNERKGYKWLLNEDTNHCLTLDFYLPKYNIAIECQGEQHFVPIEHFGGEIQLKKNKKYDNLKKELCLKNSVRIIYFLDEKYNIYMKDDDAYFNDAESLVGYIKSLEL